MLDEDVGKLSITLPPQIFLETLPRRQLAFIIADNLPGPPWTFPPKRLAERMNRALHVKMNRDTRRRGFIIEDIARYVRSHVIPASILHR